MDFATAINDLIKARIDHTSAVIDRVLCDMAEQLITVYGCHLRNLHLHRLDSDNYVYLWYCPIKQIGYKVWIQDDKYTRNMMRNTSLERALNMPICED